MSKYEPLSSFLTSRPARTLQLDFEAIEKILGFKLPMSAYDYDAWWSNNETGHSHARSWLEAGWHMSEVDRAKRKVTFRRVAAPPALKQPMPSKSDAWGCMADTITIMPNTDLTAPSGEEWNAEKGLLV